MIGLKATAWISIATLIMCGLPLFNVAALDQPAMSQSVGEQTKNPDTAVGMPVYKPTMHGAPGGRVGGGTRSRGKDSPILSVLAPDHAGLTTEEQPTLLWYLSKPTTDPIELTVVHSRDKQTTLETKLQLPSKSGVQQVRLADYGIHLLPGVQYQWFVALVPDPDRRAKDIIAGATIERITPPKDIETKLAQGDKTSFPHIYADAGLWYDSVTSISNLIDTAPNDLAFHKQRASLLEQVGLVEIAQYDLNFNAAIQ